MVWLNGFEFLPNEIMILLLSLSFSAIYLMGRKKIKNIPYRNYFEISLLCLVISKIITVIETLFWEILLNFVEHILLFFYVLFLAIWILRTVNYAQKGILND